MCIFTGPVQSVNGTRIFTGELDDGTHGCVYSMKANIRKPVAMVLPIPVADRVEDAIEFVNLEKCKDFFKELENCWEVYLTKSFSRGIGVASSNRSLKVHDVGQYIASFVPTGLHFKKLDERFRLKPDTIAAFKGYKDFSYVVFQLKESQSESDFHPMAFKYKSTNPDELFFPTVHIHDDGDYHAKAHYDHVIYAQPKTQYPQWRGIWKKSDYYPSYKFKEIEKAEGLVHPDRHLFKLSLFSNLPNHDIIFAGTDSKTRSPIDEAVA